MREKKLTEHQTKKIAEILERTEAASYKIVGMMIDTATMGIEPDNYPSYYNYQYTTKQVKRALTTERHDGSKTPTFSTFMEEQILQFQKEVINPFVEKYYPTIYKMINDGLMWDMEFADDYPGFRFCLMEHIDEAVGDTMFFGVDVWDEEDCGCEEEETLTEETK